MAKPARDARVDEVLTMLGIHALAARYPNEISGGQQQRVAIARTIAPKPGVLLFDEPLSNLDAKLRVAMRPNLCAFTGRPGPRRFTSPMIRPRRCRWPRMLR